MGKVEEILDVNDQSRLNDLFLKFNYLFLMSLMKAMISRLLAPLAGRYIDAHL